MKRALSAGAWTIVTCAACVMFASSPTWAGETDGDPTTVGASGVVAEPAPENTASDERERPPRASTLTGEQRRDIEQRIRNNIELLRTEGRLIDTTRTEVGNFGWPLRMAPGVDDPGFHSVSYFVDNGRFFPDDIEDYECGERTYDTANGNHKGTDYIAWPYPFLKLGGDHVQVVSVADGQIVEKQDGYYDRNCEANEVEGNEIYVYHHDGSTAWYRHLKKWSLTPKKIGDRVLEGEYLGVIGSSGSSSYPHLHFEVREVVDHGVERPVDPYDGACNDSVDKSWWKEQRPYYDSGVNLLTTGYDAPAPYDSDLCPNPGDPKSQVIFDYGDRIYYTAYHRDILAGHVSRFKVFDSENQLVFDESHSIEVPHKYTKYFYKYRDVRSWDPEGMWRFEVEYLGDTYVRWFYLGVPGPSGRVPQYPAQGDMLRIERVAEGQISLFWGESCLASDTDYVVYRGPIVENAEEQDWTTYDQEACSTSGAQSYTYTFDPGRGDPGQIVGDFFLVAGRNSEHEGSLGRTSVGAMRPAGTTPCAVRLVINCP